MEANITDKERYVLRLLLRRAPEPRRFVAPENKSALVRLAYRGWANIETDAKNPQCLRGQITDKGRAVLASSDA